MAEDNLKTLQRENLSESELILNADGSVYHLKLLPDQIARKIILVGDPERAPKLSKHFDRLEFEVSNREFLTHTGTLGNERVSVISTGIGTDNIDIVLNELDALVNIDLKERKIKHEKTSLEIVRVGSQLTMFPVHGVDRVDLPEKMPRH